MKTKINKFFSSNKAAMILSVLISFCIWVKLSTGTSERITKTISNIPITIGLSESAKEAGLKVFGLEDVSAEVTISGNRMVLGQITKDDITVFSQQSAGIINSAGTYNLELSARKNGRITDYEILNLISPRSVNVFVDRLQTKTFEIAQNISFNTDKENFIGTTAISEPSVTISGPESIVSSINKVCIEKEIKNFLMESVNIKDLPLILYDESGKKVATNNLKFSITKVDATINVLAKKTVSVVPMFLNKPQNLALDSSRLILDHSKIEVAASKDILSTLSTISLENLDFSNINLNNKEFNLPLKIPGGVRNLSNIYSVNLKLNMNGIQSKKLRTSNIVLVNLLPGSSAVPFTKSVVAEIVGPANELKNIDSQDLIVEVNLAQRGNFKGVTDLPAVVKIRAPSSCWAYGKYTVTVQVS